MSLRIRVSADGRVIISRKFDEKSVVIGRDADCQLRLDDVGVSRRHARIDRQGPGYLLRDLGSSNGTFIDDRTVSIWPLKDGDSARIAGFDLRFQVIDNDSSASTQAERASANRRDARIAPPETTEAQHEDDRTCG